MNFFRVMYPMRCIIFSLYQGLYLYQDTLAVLSVQQQTIHILLIEESGKLQDIRSIGELATIILI